MSILHIFIVAVCGMLIGVALLLLARSLRRMVRGQCCEGCVGCAHARGCSSRDPKVNEQGEKLSGGPDDNG